MKRTVTRFNPALFREQGADPEWIEVDGAVIANPRLGVYLVRVTSLDGDRILYDHVLRAERGGAIFVPVDQRGRVGLQAVWRPQAKDPERWAVSFPAIDFATLGRISYEIPRGFSEQGETAARTAVREAEQETQGHVTETHSLGPICDNTSFSPHLTATFWGQITMSDETTNEPEPAESILGPLTFFTRRELSRLQREGELYDGLTLGALAMLWLHRPELFEGADP